MAPTMAREAPTEGYRAQIAAAARIAAARGGTVIVGGTEAALGDRRCAALDPDGDRRPRRDRQRLGRRFSAAERTDLKAIATRLTRELSWLTTTAGSSPRASACSRRASTIR